MAEEKEEMTEDTAAKADAGAEMVFKPSRRTVALYAFATVLFCAAILINILRKQSESFDIFLNLFVLFIVVWGCLNFSRFEVRLSRSTLTVQFIWRRRVIASHDLRYIRMGGFRVLKVAYEDQGRIRHVKIRCLIMSLSDRQRLISTLREFWSELFTE